MLKKYLKIACLIILGMSVFSVQAMQQMIDDTPELKKRVELMKNGGFGTISVEALRKVIKIMKPLIGQVENSKIMLLPETMASVFCINELYSMGNQKLLEKVVTNVIYSYWKELPSGMNAVKKINEAFNCLVTLSTKKAINSPLFLTMQHNISALVYMLKGYSPALGFSSAEDAIGFFKKCLDGYYNKIENNQSNILIFQNLVNNVVFNNIVVNNFPPNNAPQNVPANNPISNNPPNSQTSQITGGDYLWSVYPNPQPQG